MFISSKVLPKLMKNAYKVKLKIGNMNDGIIIISAEWMVWLDEQYISNKIKAAIMELLGTIPKSGEAFSVWKDAKEPQREIIDDIVKNLFESIEDADQKLTITPITLNTWGQFRLMQTDNELKSIVQLNEGLLDLIDKSEINLDVEGDPTGPCFVGDPYKGIYWYNDTCKLWILPVKYKTNILFDALSEVNFDEKVLAEAEG
jgi:hypothetical protein